MTGDSRDRGRSEGDGANGSAPVDFDRLDLVRDRLRTDERFERIEWNPERAANALVCHFDLGLYPPAIRAARLEIVWYENGDFSVHYHEDHRDGSFDHRWDRHPSDHNARDHVHPGPDAPTPGTDTTYPTDWRDVIAEILIEIDDRLRAFWTDE